MKKFIRKIEDLNIKYTTSKKGIVITKENGNVYLESLTTLPEGVKFENQGYVYLRSLTTLPEGVKFENQGYVDLRSLTDKTIKYRGKKYKIKSIDGSTMIIESERKKGDFTIYKCKYFGGGSVGKLKKCYVVHRGDYFAHGDNLKQATEDVNFKFLQNNLDISKLVEEIKIKKTVTISEYRLLTGACSFGVTQFLKEKKIEKTELSLKTTLEIIDGHYGSGRMYELFN